MYTKQIEYHQNKLNEYLAKQAQYELEKKKVTAYDSILTASSSNHPVPMIVGMYVEAGHDYYCQNVIGTAIKSGYPRGMTDTEYFDNLRTESTGTT